MGPAPDRRMRALRSASGVRTPSDNGSYVALRRRVTCHGGWRKVLRARCLRPGGGIDFWGRVATLRLLTHTCCPCYTLRYDIVRLLPRRDGSCFDPLSVHVGAPWES